MTEPARVILSDPPWAFQDQLPGKGRGASKFYACMPTADIMRHPLPTIADDAMLLLWRVASMQQDALDVVRAWGFVLKSEVVWRKTTAAGHPSFGMGRYVRNAHEVCLVATRGRFRVRDRAVVSTFAAPVQEHSRKPDEIYEVAERLSAGPYVELFSRRRRDGWIQFGDQLK